MRETLIDYLTEEEKEELKQKMGEKRFYETFYDNYESLEDSNTDGEGYILNGCRNKII